MKKIFVFVLALCLLCGCGTGQVDYQKLLETSLAAVNEKPKDTANHTKDYYAYYLPPDVGRLSGDETGNTLDWYGTKFVINLNIAGIVEETKQTDTSERVLFDEDKAVYKVHGTFEDMSGFTHNFQVMIADLKDSYASYMHTDYVDFFAVSDLLTAVKLPAKMLRIARSVRVDQQRVVQDFSKRSDITYTAHKIELFQNLAPENGTIDELLIDGSNRIGTGQDEVQKPEKGMEISE